MFLFCRIVKCFERVVIGKVLTYFGLFVTYFGLFAHVSEGLQLIMDGSWLISEGSYCWAEVFNSILFEIWFDPFGFVRLTHVLCLSFYECVFLTQQMFCDLGLFMNQTCFVRWAGLTCFCSIFFFGGEFRWWRAPRREPYVSFMSSVYSKIFIFS